MAAEVISFQIKPIRDFLDNKAILQRIPEEMLPYSEKPVPWTGYLAFNEDDTFVGLCGFKDLPDKLSHVEIAYFTFPEFEHRGYATKMARLLVEIAKESKDAVAILAHTLRTTNASARICRRLEFRCLGEVTDPEDGLVWRWCLDLTEEG